MKAVYRRARFRYKWKKQVSQILFPAASCLVSLKSDSR